MTAIPFRVYNHTSYPLVIKDSFLTSNDNTLQLYPDSMSSTINIYTSKTSYQLYKITYTGNDSDGNDAGKGITGEERITVNDNSIETNTEAFINCSQLTKVKDVVNNNISMYLKFNDKDITTYNTTNFYYALYLFEMTHLKNNDIIATGGTGNTGNTGSTGDTGVTGNTGNTEDDDIDNTTIIGDNNTNKLYSINSSSICYYISQIPIAYKVDNNIVKIDQRLGPLEFFYKIFINKYKTDLESSINFFNNKITEKYSTNNGNNDINLLSYENTNVLYTRLNLYKEYSTLISYLYYKLRYNLNYINISDSSYEPDLCWITDTTGTELTLDYYKNMILRELGTIDINYKKIILIKKNYIKFNNCINFINKFNNILEDYVFNISTKSLEWKDKLEKTFIIITNTYKIFTDSYKNFIASKLIFNINKEPTFYTVDEASYNNNVKYKKINYYLSILTYLFDKVDYLFIVNFFDNWTDSDYARFRNIWPITSYAYLNKYFTSSGSSTLPTGNIQDLYELKISTVIKELLSDIGIETSTSTIYSFTELLNQINNLNNFEYNGTNYTLFLNNTEKNTIINQLDYVEKEILEQGLSNYYMNMSNNNNIISDQTQQGYNAKYYYVLNTIADLTIPSTGSGSSIISYQKNLQDASIMCSSYIYDGGFSPYKYKITGGAGSMNTNSMQAAIYNLLNWFMANYVYKSLNESNNIDRNLLAITADNKLVCRSNIEQIINLSENIKNQIKNFVMCKWSSNNNGYTAGIVCVPGNNDNVISGDTGSNVNNKGIILIDFSSILYYFQLSDIYNNNKYTLEYFKEYVKNYHSEFNDIIYQCKKYGYRVTPTDNYTLFVQKRWDLYRTYINPIESYQGMSNKSPEMYITLMNNNIISTMVYVIGYVNSFMNSFIFSSTILQSTYYNYLRNSKFILQKCMDEISNVVNEYYNLNTKTYKTLLLNNNYQINYIKQVNEAHQYNYFKSMLLYINKSETSSIQEINYTITYNINHFNNTLDAIINSNNINNLFLVYITNTFIKYITKYNYLNNSAFNYQNKTLPIIGSYYKIQINTYKTFLDVINLGDTNNLKSYSATNDINIVRMSFMKNKMQTDYTSNSTKMKSYNINNNINDTRGVDYNKIKIETNIKNIVYSLYNYSNTDNETTWVDFTNKREFWYYMLSDFTGNNIIYPNWYFGSTQFNFSTITIDYYIECFKMTIGYLNTNSNNKTSSIDNTKLWADSNIKLRSIFYKIIQTGYINYNEITTFLNTTFQLINIISHTNYKDTSKIPAFDDGLSTSWDIMSIQKNHFIALFNCGLDTYFQTRTTGTHTSISKANCLINIRNIYSSLIYYSVNDSDVTLNVPERFYELANGVGKSSFSFETTLEYYRYITEINNSNNTFNSGTTPFAIICIQTGDSPAIYNKLKSDAWLANTSENTNANTLACINKSVFTNNLALISLFIDSSIGTTYEAKINTFMANFTTYINNISSNPTFTITGLTTVTPSSNLINTNYYDLWNKLNGYCNSTTAITGVDSIEYSSIDGTKIMGNYKVIIYRIINANDGTVEDKLIKFLKKCNIDTAYSSWSFNNSDLLSNYPGDWSGGIYDISNIYYYQITSNSNTGDDKPAHWFFSYAINKTSANYGRTSLDSTSIDYTKFTQNLPKLIIHVLNSIRSDDTLTWADAWHALINMMDIEYMIQNYNINTVNNFLNGYIKNTTERLRYYQKSDSLAAFNKLYLFYNHSGYTYDSIDISKLNTNRYTFYIALKNNAATDGSGLEKFNLYDYVIAYGENTINNNIIGISISLIQKDNILGLYNLLVDYKIRANTYYSSYSTIKYALFDYSKMNNNCVKLAYGLLATDSSLNITTLEYYKEIYANWGFNEATYVTYFNTLDNNAKTYLYNNMFDQSYFDIRNTVAYKTYSERSFSSVYLAYIIQPNLFARSRVRNLLPYLITIWAKDNKHTSNYIAESTNFKSKMVAIDISTDMFDTYQRVSSWSTNTFSLSPRNFNNIYMIEPATYKIATSLNGTTQLTYSRLDKDVIKFRNIADINVTNTLNIGGGNWGNQFTFIPASSMLLSSNEIKRYYIIKNQYNQLLYAYGYNNTIRRAYDYNNSNYEGDPDFGGSEFISIYRDILRRDPKKNISELTACNNSFPEGTSNSLVYLWEVQYTSSKKINQISLRSCYGYLGTNSTVRNTSPVTLYITKTGSINYDELLA
jgi:hypothetical protein